MLQSATTVIQSAGAETSRVQPEVAQRIPQFRGVLAIELPGGRTADGGLRAQSARPIPGLRADSSPRGRVAETVTPDSDSFVTLREPLVGP